MSTVEGRPTRGRTAPDRLRALDEWLVHAEGTLLAQRDGVFVDVGIGDHPGTTLASAEALRAVNPALVVIGVDIDPARVATATQLSPGVYFRVGGFDLPLGPDEPARLVRAMNVLRQYRPEDVPAAHARLAARVLPGGLVLEGSSDPEGGVLVAHLLRATPGGHTREGLLFHTDFTHGFAPLLFRDRLPRDLRHVAPGTPMHTFFRAWTAAWQGVRGTGPPAEVFVRSIEGLAARVSGVDLDPWALARGTMVWRTGYPGA